MRILLTGATGKVGRNFLEEFLGDSDWQHAEVVALCHNRTLPDIERVTLIKGSVADRETVAEAMNGVTHVIHMSAVKESPDIAMDVSVKGLFWLLEEFRASATARQFILISGDCTVGHIFQPHDGPVTETAPRRAYPGVYALSKVLEETMLETYQVQYGINGCCLRAPWIMEKDDFRYALSFGEDQFGGPHWQELMSGEELEACRDGETAPLLLDREGEPLRRNIVHVSDLVSAIIAALDNPAAHQQLFNIGMDRPVDYGEVAAHLQQHRGFRPVKIPSTFHSNWFDNAKARLRLAWEPKYDLHKLIEDAFSYRRAADDPRTVWYPG